MIWRIMDDEINSRKQNCTTLLSFIISRCPVQIMMNTKERTKFTIFRNPQIFRVPLIIIIFSKENTEEISKTSLIITIFSKKDKKFSETRWVLSYFQKKKIPNLNFFRNLWVLSYFQKKKGQIYKFSGALWVMSYFQKKKRPNFQEPSELCHIFKINE